MSRRSVRVGIVGVGNCASFVQALSYYRDANANEPVSGLPVPGLKNIELGGYHVGDIEVASAFDIVIDAVRCAKPARPRHRRSPHRPLARFHEVSARAVLGLRGARAHDPFHQGRDRADALKKP